jgi:hypothetical protein
MRRPTLRATAVLDDRPNSRPSSANVGAKSNDNAMRIKHVAAMLILLIAHRAVLAEPFDQADLTGTDDLGRQLPSIEQTGAQKPNRCVGLFYWQWHGTLRALPGAFNMTDFLQTHPKFMDFNAYPPGGPRNPEIYWAQPLFGYYRSTDPWVIRKHLPMFAAAGIDFLFFDYTNSSIYDPELTTFLSVAEDLKSKGLAVPRLTFFLNHLPDQKVESLYQEWYKPGKYDDMWFGWRGKPLLMTEMPIDASKLKNPAMLVEIQHYFTWRPTWALSRADKNPQLWRFLSDPIDPPALDKSGRVEQMVVNKSMGGPIWNSLAMGGVSAGPGVKDHTAADYDGNWMLPDAAHGVCFQAEWAHATKVAPPILLITGWNEWTASIWEKPGVIMLGRKTGTGQGYIVDEFNMQFNRDLEPMKGGYGDDYYWQLVENMRRYKGMLPRQRVSKEKTIAVTGPISQWNGVTPMFPGVVGATADRDWDASVKGGHYVDQTARNEIESAQIAHDPSTVWFHVHTTAPLTPGTDPNWMILMVDIDENAKTGWHGYDLLVNRRRIGSNASVEKNVGDGWTWEPVESAQAHRDGNDLVIALPRSLFRSGQLRFDFKWIDNMGDQPEVMDFYGRGSTAPVGRFNFRFEERP